MHNRARMAVASFLTKDLYIDWRAGAWHFWDLLSDGEIANNAGNWQWVAGTGNDTRPNRVLSPVRQAERFDPDGAYVRRYLPELESIRGKAIFRPWRIKGFEPPRLPRADRRPRRGRGAFRAHREMSAAVLVSLCVTKDCRTLGSRHGTTGGDPRQQRARAGGEEIAAAAAEHGAAIVQRHGAVDATYVLPHEIDFAANLRPLAEQGATGSWRSARSAGSAPSCRSAACSAPTTSSRSTSAPRSSPTPAPTRRPASTRVAGRSDRGRAAGGQAPHDGGVYWQTRGPRFETPAEIRLIAAHADVVGMTIASECVVAGELGLDYAALCVVDNLANGDR